MRKLLLTIIFLSSLLVGHGQEQISDEMIARYAIDLNYYDRSSPHVFIKNGITLKDDNDYENAIKSFKHAQKLDPYDPNIYYLLAQSYKKLNDTLQTVLCYNQAIKTFEEGHYLNVNPYFLYFDLGAYSIFNSDYEYGEKLFTKALRYNETAKAYCNRGNCRIMLKRKDEACSDWGIALNNGIEEVKPLLEKWCKNCSIEEQDRLQQKRNRSIDYYPIDNDTLYVLLHYSPDWYLQKKRGVFFRTARWIQSLQKFDGPFTDYIRNNKVGQGNYINNKLNGLYQGFYRNGQLECTGFFEDNKPKGVWIYYYPDKKPKLTVNFSDNGFEVLGYLDRNGNKLLENGNGNWAFDFIDSQNRTITSKGSYKNNKRVGKWMVKCIPSEGEIVLNYSNDGELKNVESNFSNHHYYYSVENMEEWIFIDYRLYRMANFFTTGEHVFDRYPFLDESKLSD